MRLAFIGHVAPDGIFPTHALRSQGRPEEQHAPWAEALCPELALRADLEVRFFTVQRAIKKPCVAVRDRVTYEGLPFPFPGRFNLLHGFRLQSFVLNRAVRHYRPDLVHAFGMETGHATMALRTGFPVSCFVQGIAEYLVPYADRSRYLNYRLKKLEKNAVNKATAFVTENNFAASWVRRHHQKASIRIIPHALRPIFLRANQAGYEESIVSVGRLDRRKGADTMLEAFGRMKSREARLCIMGDGPLRATLEKQAAALGVADRVRFTGPLEAEAIIAELQRSRLFVMASRMDTSPNAVSEAHAVGLPVIGTRVGGIPEMIEEGTDGFLVDVDDAEAMAERMDALWADPERCRRMGEKGRAKVRVLNDPARIAEEHYAYFRELMGRIG